MLIPSTALRIVGRVSVIVRFSALVVLIGGFHVSAWASEGASDALSTFTAPLPIAETDADLLEDSSASEHFESEARHEAGRPQETIESERGHTLEPADETHGDQAEDTEAVSKSTTESAAVRNQAEVFVNDDNDAHDAELRALEEALAADVDDTADIDSEGNSEPTHNASDNTQSTGFQRAAQALNNALNPEISLTLNVAASYFSNEPMQIGHHDPNRNGFTFQELELAFSANVDPYFKFKGYLSATEHGVELEEAYAQTTSLPARLQLRAGKFLNRFGRINSRHPHAWNFLDMPLVMGRFLGDEGLAGTGIEASWLAPTPWYLELVMSAVHGAEARSFRGEDSSIDSMRDFVYVGAVKNHFAFGPSWSLAWGVSGAFGRNNATWEEGVLDTAIADLPTHGLTQIYGTDLYLRFRPVDAAGYRAFSLQFEFMHRRREVGGMLLANNGLYAQAIGNISQRWEVGARYEWVDGSSLDDLDPEWTGDRHRMSVQGTFYPSHFSRIRLQTNYDHPTWTKQPIVAVMLGLELSIGAHGAHKF